MITEGTKTTWAVVYYCSCFGYFLFTIMTTEGLRISQRCGVRRILSPYGIVTIHVPGLGVVLLFWLLCLVSFQ